MRVVIIKKEKTEEIFFTRKTARFFGVITFLWFWTGCFVYASPVEHYVIDCKIFNSNLKLIKDMQGDFCIFNEDGSFVRGVSSNGGLDGKISLITAYGDTVWSRQIIPHHQINASLNNKEILVLAQEYKDLEWCHSRQDVFEILDLKTGRTLKRMAIFDQKSDYFKNYPRVRLTKETKRPQFNCELSHFNSFYEIGNNLASRRLPAFLKGNYIVNAETEGFFIIDRHLKNIIWHADISDKIAGTTHDVQVLENGEMLFFSNHGLKKFPNQSTLNIYDPLLSSLKTLYPKKLVETNFVFRFAGIKLEIENKETVDFAPINGSVQLTQQGILFSMNTLEKGGTANLANYKKELIWQKTPLQVSIKTKLPEEFQQIKQFDLSKFLERNKL